MGVDLPVAVTTGDSTSYQYRNVGTSIDCTVKVSSGDLYQVDLQVENSSVIGGSDERPSTLDAAIAHDRALFRSFRVALSPVLRDGHAVQIVASTDPVTGEVVKIDVTLNVMK